MNYSPWLRMWGSKPPTWISYRDDGRTVRLIGSEPSILTEFDLWWHEARMTHDPHYRRRVEGRIQDIGECKMRSFDQIKRVLLSLQKE